MTPSDLDTAVRQRYNAVGDPHFPSEMVYDLIYQAEMELAIETDCIERSYSTTSVADQREYAYPTAARKIRRIEYKGVMVHPARLERDPKTSTTESTGTPTLYALWNDEIIFFPTPDTSGDTIKIYTYDEASEIAVNSTLATPAEYHLGIIDYLMSAFYAKDKDRNMSDYHLQKWERFKARVKQDVAKKKRGDKFAVVADEEEFIEQPVVYL